MKKVSTFCFCLMILGVGLVSQGCGNAKKEHSTDIVVVEQCDTVSLVTERQECQLKHFKHLTGEIYPLTIAMDIPVKGTQLLIDSIAVFLNENLYAFFDNGEERHLPYESIFSMEVGKLMEHYLKAYSPFFLPDSTTEHEFATDCLEINLMAQTNTYVTYEVNNIFYGEGVETAKEWVTFSKSDGHRLVEIISNNEMLRFYREQPQLRNEAIWEDIFNHNSGEDNPHDVVCSVGLLNDSVAHQYVYAPGIFEYAIYPLDGIASYLTKEARELVQKSIGISLNTQ